MSLEVYSAEIVDAEAVRIGQLYVQARSSIVVAVKYLMECGRSLAAKATKLLSNTSSLVGGTAVFARLEILN